LKNEAPSRPATVNKPDGSTESGRGIAVGDTVRMRYLTDDRKTLQITISKAKSDPSEGLVYHEAPVARALLGAEVGDEVEVLVGSYVGPAVVERIIKGAV
jgi:transcription elongation GreA/GreB family factor